MCEKVAFFIFFASCLRYGCSDQLGVSVFCLAAFIEILTAFFFGIGNGFDMSVQLLSRFIELGFSTRNHWKLNFCLDGLQRILFSFISSVECPSACLPVCLTVHLSVCFSILPCSSVWLILVRVTLYKFLDMIDMSLDEIQIWKHENHKVFRKHTNLLKETVGIVPPSSNMLPL